jgi:two-component system, OmpR family, KDP operon response regulator KdpE
VSAVLLVEDDRTLRRALRATFRNWDFDVAEAESGEEALSIASDAPPDLVVLDLTLPGIDGLETLRHLRTFSDVPVVVLTVRDSLRDKVAALESGADDYVLKPFEPEELLARSRAHLRRAAPDPSRAAVVRAGDVVVDLVARQVTWCDEPVQLTPTELRMLEVLLTNRGKLVTREQLLEAVWGSRAPSDRGRVRVFMVHLRRKLHDDAARPRLILTEPGIGYRWIGDGEDLDD